MKKHEESEEQRKAGNQVSKPGGQAPETMEGSLRDLQSSAGNRAVSDLVSGAGPAVQGNFFGGAFGGLEDWIAKQAPQSRPSFDPSIKEDPGVAGMKEEPSDGSLKAGDASDKFDGSDKFDASDKFDGSDKFDASQKYDGSDKFDAGDKFEGPEKWDASEKFDASEKWDGSEKSEGDLASKDDQLEAKTAEGW
jgi:hypothetical protein